MTNHKEHAWKLCGIQNGVHLPISLVTMSDTACHSTSCEILVSRKSYKRRKGIQISHPQCLHFLEQWHLFCL